MQRQTIVAVAALMLSGGSAVAQDAPPVLSVDDSLICAGLFFAQASLPENVSLAENVTTYRQVTTVFLDRAEILAAREGKGVEGHTERVAAVASSLIAMVDAAPDPSGRQAVIAEWQELEDLCIAGGRVPV